jgi:N-methylhydantoinase A
LASPAPRASATIDAVELEIAEMTNAQARALASPGAPAAERLVVGIDTGGTFTDIVVLHPDGRVTVNKSPTTPKNFSQGVLDAVAIAADSLQISTGQFLERTSMFKHGTTVATNALITRRGAKVGLITTRGFEDTIYVMRAVGRVDGLSEMEIKHVTKVTKPKPLVPRQLIRGVHERIDYKGEIVVRLDVEGTREAVRELVEVRGVEAIAVSLLFSWMNPAHENEVARIVRELYPDRNLAVTLSHELAPQMGEYARSNTAVVNGFLWNTIDRYVSGLNRQLKGLGLPDDVMVMQANGGIVRPQQMTGVGTLQSGPAGGMIATRFVAQTLGHANVITADMGGTSFDVGLLTDNQFSHAREPIAERFRLLQPMIDVESIGAGGGTIARIDPLTGRLLVGPDSAGADPGPICYGLGGSQVTVTDANVVLGYIDPDYFLGGRRKLDKQAAEEAIDRLIARPLRLSLEQAVGGIYDVINSKMSDLIRRQVVRAGHVPEEYVIYAFGGAGPVHAAAYGAELGINRVYIFPMSPVFSAFGVAASDVVHTRMVTRHLSTPINVEALHAELQSIEATLQRIMLEEGFATEDIAFRRTLYMRYTRQVNEVGVQIPTGPLQASDRARIETAFNAKYEEMYGGGAGHAEAGIEIISIAVDAIGATVKPKLRKVDIVGPDSSAARKGQRRAWFTGAEFGFRDTAIYDYTKLQAGNVVEGPAIIETPFTTVVVPPSHRAEVDAYLNVVLHR